MCRDQWKNSHILFPVPTVLEMVMTSATLEIQNKRKKNDLRKNSAAHIFKASTVNVIKMASWV